jgi:hypothetical protein
MVNQSGYGRIRTMGEHGWTYDGAHRVSWELHRGPIPTGMWVLHRCDNPPCSNPDHLFLGTHTENMADMAKKGRANTPDSQGEANANAKLTVADVHAIRRLAADPKYTTGDIGELFRVNRNHVLGILKGKAWAAA